MSSSSWIKTRDSPKPRGETENATEQKEKELSPLNIMDLRAEFERLFKSKAWRGVHKLPKNGSNRRALVVAISYGERRPPHRLYGTFVDALRIIRMLEGFDYKPGDICVLADIAIPTSTTDSESDSSEENDSESRLPKKVNILKGIKWLASSGGPGQYRFIFFSGHGHFQPSKYTPAPNQCIMPKDVEFQRLNSCNDCICSKNVWRASDKDEELPLVPEPSSVIWDHNINQKLTTSLRSGTKFTAVFDCCYSAGILEDAFQNGPGTEIINSVEPNSKGRAFNPVVAAPLSRVINQEWQTPVIQGPLQTEDVVMVDSDEQPPESSEALSPTQTSSYTHSLAAGNTSRGFSGGNFLGLPVEVDLITGGESDVPQPLNMDFIQASLEKKTRFPEYNKEKTQNSPNPWLELWTIAMRNEKTSPSAEVPQLLSESSCQRKGITAALKPFNDGCNIMCWAACRRLESALEDGTNAGRFTEAFTEFLTRPRIKEETQLPRSTDILINHLRVKFEKYNSEARTKGWDEQHPKLFMSKSSQSGNYLQQELDI